jgi:hypothetical protein
MNTTEIFRQAARAADEATMAQFGATGTNSSPTPTNAAGDYWTLVYQATVSALLKHNGSY